MDLKFVIDNLQDFQALPLEQSSALKTQYQLIAKDQELSERAIDKCKAVFQQWSFQNVNIEVVKRFRDLWYTIKGKDYPLVGFPFTNLTVQQVDLDQYIRKQREELMKNQTVEEVEITDYL